MPLRPADIAVTALAWTPCHRLIASRYPTVGLYDDIARPEDLDVVFAIEALTNPRVRQEAGDLSLVAPEDRVAGPGSTLVMAAFTHLNPDGSRFSDGSYGVYYAAQSLKTAVAEVGHHRGVFLARTAEPEIDVDLRWIQADLHADVHDIRLMPTASAEAMRLHRRRHGRILDPDDYGPGQALGHALREAGSAALAYDSVRHAGGTCAAVFVPRALSRARAAGHLSLHWDGQRISHWYEKGEPHPLDAPAPRPTTGLPTTPPPPTGRRRP